MASEDKKEVASNAQALCEDGSSDQGKERTAADTAMGEAIAVYGNVEAFERAGYVQRGYAAYSAGPAVILTDLYIA